MKLLGSSSPFHTLVLFFVFFLSCSVLVLHGRAQTSTDPDEVRALNAIFTKWKISSSMSKFVWNDTGTGDPCTDLTINIDDKTRDDDVNFNPAIMCRCSNNKCHIIRLKATNLNITGTIPDELKVLKFLNNLQIAKNFLTGPLPAFIGDFSDMEYLSVGLNSLTGPLPKELGKLTKLVSLGLGSRNNFSGPLPPELGNLTALEQMYVDSCGFSGAIPETLVKLKKLKIMWASDNNFRGTVPEFLGKITTLKSLKLEGNSFQGPIPSSFVNLTGMTTLFLGDISNVSSSLAFIRNMKSLEKLSLRDCMIEDTIPPNIGEYQNLIFLDLSFNRLTGELPASLFNTAKLNILYLGNNTLSGNLPSEKSPGLSQIDLSYNQLSGDFPQWVVAQNGLQLNLVANNFKFEDGNSGLRLGLRCLQRDIPCSRGSPNYYSFAINCGGSETVTSDGTSFEQDDKDLSTAPYFMTNTQRWAVSSVGTFQDNPALSYLANTSHAIMNTSDPVLFQSARLSPSSLRYYGIGLENGPYSITLLFAETLYGDNNVWQSFGRRIFDIFIQGNLVDKDFDIKKEAEGRPFRAIKKVYTANVTDNFLEIHFFWAGKGTCCIPVDGTYGPLISAISITPNFKPTVSNQPPRLGTKGKNKGRIAGIVVGIAALIVISVLVIFFWRKKKRHLTDDEGDEELGELDVVPNSFSYMELKNSTNDFSVVNKLGEGGFGPVYKGILPDRKIVAVKQLSVASFQGKKQFVAEVATISAVKHRNLVILLGCCYEGANRLLVYEYLENKSLDQALFGNSNLHLDWNTRFRICLGTARGLTYLHEESRPRIIHRDIKASNILLDADLSPKISDFGLAKLYDDKMTHISTKVAGTIGYLAPEYAMRGHLTEKADVFSFGVVAFEILCGRPNTCHKFEEDRIYLLEWAWKLHEEKRDLEMLDPTLASFNKDEVFRMIGVAFICTQVNPLLRPTMSRVVAMLVGDAEIEDVISRPSYLSDWHFDEFNETMGTSSFAISSTSNLLMKHEAEGR